MNADELPAGPELNLLMGELMGWALTTGGQWRGSEKIAARLTDSPDFSDMDDDEESGMAVAPGGTSQAVFYSQAAGWPEWDPAGNIACAWEVAEKFRLMVFPNKDGWAAATVRYDPDGEGPQHGEHYIDDSLDHYATAPTAPLAICRAALKAKGAK